MQEELEKEVNKAKALGKIIILLDGMQNKNLSDTLVRLERGASLSFCVNFIILRSIFLSYDVQA